MKLIIGLGNPGRRYRGTRHNVGWEVVSRLGRRLGVAAWQEEGFSEVRRGSIGGTRVLLARPQTYVNVSGAAVLELCRRHRVDVQDIIVVADDLDLPLGRIRLRPGGSAGGHNGLKSIIEALGTTNFPRLRVGIGRPPEGVDPADYVLARFRPEEQPVVDEVLERAAQALEVAVTEGIPAAMNRFNATTGRPGGRGRDGEGIPPHA
ncbi:MAG: aminoacyl-tRNA hydrolase [Armatimonadota bacterium]|nr:aminoacyl-tRNA hydrolase [Armatimonadota bacterium]MDR7451136.1 aminoacyl-tRNA hydrolase [Armatimonadota bacterium]MDR7467259.1 aminoacyl-tRNA hydrolase [Armatimonadota bacterium]MDR7494520.1 aminoacyl-tRNA hydrolase [Armatimonadota bacterium]MDR7499903.1 aminoacyl-tRNA hydrolase [Armatimonadota bacterium]